MIQRGRFNTAENTIGGQNNAGGIFKINLAGVRKRKLSCIVYRIVHDGVPPAASGVDKEAETWGIAMTNTLCSAAKKQIFGNTIKALLLLCVWTASSAAQTATDRQKSVVQPLSAKGYVYWTNNNDGTVGRATVQGTGVNEKFIALQNPGGAGMTLDKKYIYWTAANGGSATTIARANLNGSHINSDFVSGAQNPCGVAVDKNYIYWAGDLGTSIGRAKLNGNGANQDFITTGTGVCGVAVTKQYIYWANYETTEIGRANIDGSNANDNFISGCGSGIAVEGKYIYFTAANGTAIGRANIDGTGVNTGFITGLNGEIAFLAVDKSYIFWADWGDRGTGTTIGRANIDGTQVNQNFITGTNGGFGIAVTDGDP